MTGKIRSAICLMMSVCLLAMAQCAFAGTWTAKLSQSDISAISQETIDMLTEHLTDTFGTEDPETGYTYSFQIAGEAEIDGKTWYVGRLSWLVDDHMSLISEFLMDQENFRVYDFVYLDSETIECEDDEAGLDSDSIGEFIEPIPYLSENGFSMCYDAVFMMPDESADDRFVAVSGEDVFYNIAVVSDLTQDSYEAFIAEGCMGAEPQMYSIALGNGIEVTCALAELENSTEYFYIIPFGKDALAISASCPASEVGEWGARFDSMTESLSF